MTNGALRILDGDLFGICRRLKAIDSSYFVAFNVKLKRFEVHSNGQRGSSLALVVPYTELDERTVRLCLKTRCERIERIMAEMRVENEKLEKKELYETVKRAEMQTEQLLCKM